MYPERHMKELKPETMEAYDTVIATGPFKYKSHIKGSVYEVERNPNYFKKGLPYLDEYHIYVMPDSAARFAALRTGKIDIIMGTDITEAQARVVEKELSDKLVLSQVAATSWNTIQMNTKEPPFDDIRVRKAVALAVDHWEANRVLAGGDGMLGSLIPPFSVWGLPTEEVLKLPGRAKTGPEKEKEREEARKLLAAAGYPDGFEVELRTRELKIYVETATFLIDQLKTIGIKATLKVFETVAYYDMLARKEFKVIAHSHAVSFFDPDLVFEAHYTCKGTENYPQICDPVLEDIFHKQARELDFKKRQKMVWDFQRRYEDLYGKIPLVFRPERSAWWKYVKNVSPGPSQYLPFRTRMERIWIEK
jgi:peptide/nickel transport system substrate-binding protein